MIIPTIPPMVCFPLLRGECLDLFYVTEPLDVRTRLNSVLSFNLHTFGIEHPLPAEFISHTLVIAERGQLQTNEAAV
jgi:hypothetical protein